MTVNYLNVEPTIGEILEATGMLCDTLNIHRSRDKRIIDFKIHSTDNKMISILLYKENHYSGIVNSLYMFECLNYDVRQQHFLNFDEFFVTGSQEKVHSIINKTIQAQIDSGNMYYDCWQISEGDFGIFRDNFVVNNDSIEFYFNDCVICPSYTGQYGVRIPFAEIRHLLTSYQQSLLTFND